MKLLVSQKDTLFDLIENVGLSPSQFEFEEKSGRITIPSTATHFRFKNSDFFFLFETGKNQIEPHYAIFSPGENAFREENYTGTWAYQLQYFARWLSNLKRELTTPNKWDRLLKEIAIIDLKFETDEDKFSIKEYEDLQIKMTTLKHGIASIGLLPEQIEVFKNRLDHLTMLAKEMNKFDWKGLFIGTIISIIIQLKVNPENAKTLWALIKQIFNDYLLP